MRLADDRDDDFLVAATQALSGPSGADALRGLGWWELLGSLSDPDARDAVFSTLRAQGRGLADTNALGGLVAQPYAELLGVEAGTIVAAVPRTATGGTQRWTMVGPSSDLPILVDVPGLGAVLAPAEALSTDRGGLPGRLCTADIVAPPAWQDLEVVLSEDAVRPVRASSVRLGRLGAAWEMLGAAESAVQLAVEYASMREQFGQPIGTFQAVRHILAWASTDTRALDSALRRGVELLDDAPPDYDAIVKALAGRNGRRACERALQVLGGIGFTTEHDHHHHHSRVLLLDSLLGSHAQLTAELGANLRLTGEDPQIAAAVVTLGPTVSVPTA